MQKKKVLICGAGVAGLATAWWLNRQNLDVEVVEKYPDFKQNGYMIGLSGPGLNIAEKMGLKNDLLQQNISIGENLYISKTGKHLHRLNYSKILEELEFLSFPRTNLVRTIYNHTKDDLPITFGEKAISFSDHAHGQTEVIFQSGSRKSYDLIIGADGIHSDLRSKFFGNESQFIHHMGYSVAAFTVDIPNTLQTEFVSYVEPSRQSQYYALNEKQLVAILCWQNNNISSIPQNSRAEYLKNIFSGANPICLERIELAKSQQAHIYLDNMAMIEMPQWSQGNKVVIGDAAYCMSLLSGQGAGMALTGAYLLSEGIKRHGLPNGMVYYENQLRKSILRLQKRSRKIASIFIPKTHYGFWLRNLSMKLIPENLLGRYFLKNIQSEIMDSENGIQEKN
ncbi:hypothetical protein WH95_16455 [Kiloniella litopenaei]|uniref:FAD-binding domain-containing protein n=1 Tax=Kiloniella litopenaei TaxID=1549748 RepID=A0A0M2R1R7_9PROT|nr:FAD-dependent oxidoreductase [Kiloniella litopenaei]KKJ75817.1 hypothetical protein WH95_16455 [Kiloniella litopenaei]